MPYSETKVLLGGLMHIPVLIVLLRLIENKLNKNNADLQRG